MPRTARLTYPGGFYHIFNRGLNKEIIFSDKNDYEKLLAKLSSLLQEGDWTIYCYILMPNHYHFLVEERKKPVSSLMGRLFTSYSQYFNKRHDRQGTLFQDRFKSKLVQKDNYFLHVSRYIHLNPVQANLCRFPEEYPYSSLMEYIGKNRRNIIDLEKIKRLLGDQKTGVEDYLRFVKEGINLNLLEFDPFVQKKEALGSAVFVTHRKMVHFRKT